jgi:hypothetical protein
MSEAEWLVCPSPGEMLIFLQGKISDRKLRLIACACCRLVWPLLRKASRKAVEIGEQLADGILNETAQANALRAAIDAACLPAAGSFTSAANMAYRCAINDGLYAAEWTIGYGPDPEKEATVLHEIAGNPFRPVVLDPAWVTWKNGTLPDLARAIYDDRSFDQLPILADALEEAGCTNADILNHCRQPGEHVRGCWLIDFLLDKQ